MSARNSQHVSLAADRAVLPALLVQQVSFAIQKSNQIVLLRGPCLLLHKIHFAVGHMEVVLFLLKACAVCNEFTFDIDTMLL